MGKHYSASHFGSNLAEAGDVSCLASAANSDDFRLAADAVPPYAMPCQTETVTLFGGCGKA